MIQLTPLSALRISRHHIPSHSGFPNTSLAPHPLYIYHASFQPPSSSPSLSGSSVSSHLRDIGVVEPQWTYPMYRQHHYHSTTHEVLVVLSGAARLCFGGETNPKRIEERVAVGDVMIIPAGLAHAMLEDEGGFTMLGSYPVGAKQWDHCTGNEGKQAEERIKKLGWFEKDPIYGDEGPVLHRDDA